MASETNILPDPEPVSLGTLRKVVPKHCFERSYKTSFRYLFQDLFGVLVCIYIGQYINLIPFDSIRLISWVLLWIIQGAIMTGLWVIAHECGHQAFSPSLYVNDFVGNIVHTILLVPYWSWKYTHGQHHSNTNSMPRDSVFVPLVESQVNKHFGINQSNRGNVISRFFGILRMNLIGWFAYLFLNYSGPKMHRRTGHWTSHFNPFCTLFNKHQRLGVIASDISLIIWIFVLYKLTKIFGMMTMIKFYWIPYLMVNHWLITITFLQHTDVKVPRYQPNAWKWLRGALGTVDRDYGIFNTFHHHIADTHVIHHIFSKIPHYHAQEATSAILKSGLIDEYYLYDDTPWYIALWNCYSQCWFVPNDQDIAFFKGSNIKLQ